MFEEEKDDELEDIIEEAIEEESEDDALLDDEAYEDESGIITS